VFATLLLSSPLLPAEGRRRVGSRNGTFAVVALTHTHTHNCREHKKEKEEAAATKTRGIVVVSSGLWLNGRRRRGCCLRRFHLHVRHVVVLVMVSHRNCVGSWRLLLVLRSSMLVVAQ
jgi:hypothetical protein